MPMFRIPSLLRGALGALCVMAAACSAPVRSAEFNLSLAIEDPTGSRPAVLAQEFAQLVDKYSGGKVAVKVYPDAQLGNLKTVIEGLQIGTVDMTKVYDALSPLLPETVILDLPYMFKTRKHFERVMNDPVIWGTMRKLETKGIVPVSWWENGYRHMTNSVRPIRTPADLKGLKMRTPANPSRLAMFRLFGANPAPLPYPELYSALQQKAFDGQENPIANIVSGRLYEVQQFLSLTGHVYGPQLLLISKVKWDALPPQAKEAVKRAGDETGQKWRDQAEQGDREDLASIASKIKINEIDFAAFQAASQTLYNESKYPDLVKRILQLVKD